MFPYIIFFILIFEIYRYCFLFFCLFAFMLNNFIFHFYCGEKYQHTEKRWYDHKMFNFSATYGRLCCKQPGAKKRVRTNVQRGIVLT